MKRLVRFQILTVALFSCTPASKVSPDKFRASAGNYRYINTIDVGTVDQGPMSRAYQQFKDMSTAGTKVITLRIDSFGGSIFLGNKWIKAVEDLKKANGVHVTCIVDGAAYSMAAVILESPLCDIRMATRRSTILFHNGSGGAEGTVKDIQGTVALLAALNEAMALTIAERLGIHVNDYKNRIADHDWVLAAPEALEMNVIDAYANPSDIAPPAQSEA
jgi:ATP-dependent protease ClpP protease subunit